MCAAVNNNTKPRSINLVLGLTGSVACIKISEKGYSLDIVVVPTKNALFFFDKDKLDKRVKVYTDEDEWSSWKQKGDPVLHIELRKWADMMLIAPLDANTMAKIANGMCDNLLTSIIRAWDTKNPILVCPAMNTFMYNHPHTERHIEILKSLNFHIIYPVVKMLACGDNGIGGMESPGEISKVVFEYLEKN
ncbi:hypothetical protein BB559_000349 [Furculomyces boomerangus]|uniref:Flavoprotein domain-containing protein n=2 Tax=Harpellales TaxID=61421 RepID=A0A2T9Z5M6_9FUNG|nr:hypothetical protein BB559_000349 [Furculomyces boomerangus]PWA01654.1 hypothetical protein BB558_002224 [Smittium angustum]